MNRAIYSAGGTTFTYLLERATNDDSNVNAHCLHADHLVNRRCFTLHYNGAATWIRRSFVNFGVLDPLVSGRVAERLNVISVIVVSVVELYGWEHLVVDRAV